MLSRRTLLKTTAVGAAGAVAAPFVVRSAEAQTVTLRMQGFLQAASPTHRAFEKMAADLRAATGDRLQISFLPAGGAVAVTETLDAVRNGILDGHYSAPSFFAARDPGFAVLGDTGASYDDVATRDRWFREGGGIDMARAFYDRYGLYYVDQVFWPSEHIPSRRALNGVADLNGLKIRCPPGLVAEVLGRTGAAVVNLPGAEVFNALQSGVIDATDWASPGQNFEVGLYRAAQFSVNAAHSMPSTEVSFSKRRWDALPGEFKQAIAEHVRRMDDGLKAQVRSDDEQALAQMRSQGVTIIEWPAAEIAKLRAFTTEVQDGFASRNDSARDIVASLRAFQRRVGTN
jgi:TRAP-type mannitol/chloroaromatic compound transport system substrate-binding protein